MAHTDSILIVDPEPAIVSVLVDLLTDEGYDVLSAANGRSAFRLSISHAPALLLVEHQLPGMTASELVVQLRGAGLTSIPIVVMTTASRAAPALCVPGVSAYLQKPFDIDDVLACVARYVQPTRAAETALRSTFVGALS